MVFKSISNDGKRVTLGDMRRALKQSKIQEELAAAEEFIERTAGVNKATHFTYEQFHDVLKGKVNKKADKHVQKIK